MWQDFWAALGLLLVLEGILPFLSPSGARRALEQAARSSDRTLRLIGLASMGAGIIVLYLVR